jgi:hypothetical protein
MNLSVVYELRDRLKTAAVAGTGLIEEDFRLKRAVEQMAPLGKASPVFGRIYQMAQKTTQPDCGSREEMVLDTLSLLDAVLCTQGSLLKEGEWEEIPGGDTKDGLCVNIPYRQMAPVLEAFRGTGSGRYAVIRDAHEAQPEIFKDFRIKNLCVKALGDSYGDLADMVAHWLLDEGRGILPLLKQGFDPAGRRDMARRVEIIDAIAGGDENGFYVEMFPKASKEVKEPLARALRHCEANEDLLLDLVKSEKGKVKEEALWSLARMNGEKAREFWKKQMGKKPEKAVNYLQNSRTMWASDLIAEYLIQWLDTFKESGLSLKQLKDEDRQRIYDLWRAALGKSSPQMCACYKRVYQVLPKETAERLWESLMEEQPAGLCQTAEELYDAYGDEFLQSVFWIDLLTKSAGEVYDRFSPYLKPEELLDAIKQIGGKKKDPMGIYQVLMRVSYEEKEGSYVVYRESWESPIRYRTVVTRLEAGLDPRWYPLLLKSKDRFNARFRKQVRNSFDNSYDAMVAGLFRPDMEGLKEAYGNYFYLGARHRGPVAADIRMLKKCGWKDYKGLLALVGKKSSRVAIYEIREILGELPLSSEELAGELEELIKSYGKSAKMGVGILEMWCGKLKSGVLARDL